MKFPLAVVFAVVLPGLSGFAQVPSIAEGSAYEPRPGQWRRVIRNQSTSPLVAFTTSCHGPRGGAIAFHDALINAGDYYVHPGESIEVSGADPSSCDGSVEAAIFLDGHVEGDLGIADKKLFSFRRGAYRALEQSIQLLTSIYTQRVPADHVIDALEAKRQSSLKDRTEASAGYTSILIEVLGALRQPHITYHLPPDNYGPKRPQQSIEDVMNSNGLSRDEARIMVFTERLKEWKSLLEGNLQPPR